MPGLISFTPCTLPASLLEAFVEAANNSASGGAVWLSPACSSFDQIRRYQQSGEILWSQAKSIRRGALRAGPNIHGKKVLTIDLNSNPEIRFRQFASGLFEERSRGNKLQSNPAPRNLCHYRQLT
jgi:hypothetical protein